MNFRTTLRDTAPDVAGVELWLELDDETMSWVSHFQTISSGEALLAHPPPGGGCCLWAGWVLVQPIIPGCRIIAVATVDGEFLKQAAASLMFRSEDRLVSKLPDGAAVVWAEVCDELQLP